MTIHLVVTVVLWSAMAQAAPPEPVQLQALYATSGSDPTPLVDGNATTGWIITGDSENEGVTLRFEEPVRADKVQVLACPGTQVPMVLYVNGAEQKRAERAVARLEAKTSRAPIQALFVWLGRDAAAKTCIGEIDLFRGTDRLVITPPRKVAGTVTATSTLDPADAYRPSYLFDGRTDFGWVEGAKGLGIGEAVTVTLGAPLEITGIELWNGYQRSASHFKKNARLKALTVSVDGSAPIALPVKDEQGSQKLMLPKPMSGKVVKLGIGAGYPGTEYQDLVISELRFLTPQGPTGVATTDAAERRTALVSMLSDKPLAQVVDRTFVSYCYWPSDTGGDSYELKLRTDNTFVIWDAGATDSQIRNDSVFDGAWVLRAQSKAGGEVELFGRRHNTDVTWNPYGAEARKESIRIDGGKLTLTLVASLTEADVTAILERWQRDAGNDRISCLDQRPNWAHGAYEALRKQGALIVEGPALTDVLRPLR